MGGRLSKPHLLIQGQAFRARSWFESIRLLNALVLYAIDLFDFPDLKSLPPKY